MTSQLRLSIALISAVAACSDPTSSSSVDAAPEDSSVRVDAASIDAPPDAAIDAMIDAPPNNCPAGQLCLRVRPVVPGATIPSGRLVVAFSQMIENAMPHPHEVVTYDIAFDGAATTIEIPLAAIPEPAPLDDYQMCPRTCLVLTNPACDCPAASAKITTAFVFVLVDVNSSGAIEPGELDEANLYGVGYLSIGGGDMAYPVPHALQGLLPDGIQDGVAPYRVIDTSSFDKMGIPAPGAGFDLDVCVPGTASCSDLRFPNFT